MSCRGCETISEIPIAFPLSLVKVLLKEPYEGVFIHECIYCKAKFIGLSVQAYDDVLVYWVRASEAEVHQALGLEQRNVFGYARVVIESRKPHIFGSFDGHYYIKDEKANVLAGMPPW
jgi:hypothetical protein